MHIVAKWRDKVTPTAKEDRSTETLEAVLLIQGTRPDGEAQWAYVKMATAHVPVFKCIEMQGDYDLSNPDVLGPGGEMLAHGQGEQPPEAITEDLRKTYDLDMHTEEALTEAVAQMLEETPLFKTLNPPPKDA